MTERWLLARAMALVAALMDERSRRANKLVMLPPEGATLHEIERAALVAALDRTGWVQADAAKLLGTTARVMNSKMTHYALYKDHPLGPKRKRPCRRPANAFGRDRVAYPRKAGKDWRSAGREDERS
jgi:hypothetical protein